MISIDVKKGKGVRRLEDIGKYTRHAIRKTWFDLGKNLKSSAIKEIISGTKTGRVYVIRGPSGKVRRHVSSAPGETHADMSGDLRLSLDYKVSGGGEKMVFGYLNDPPIYARVIEKGSDKIKARPTLKNAWKDQSHQVERHFMVEMTRVFD